jgi:hypothetical protein
LTSERCEECARLWQEFVQATNAHLRLVGQLQIAVMQQDSAAIAELNRAVAESAAKRQIARNAFRAHSAMHLEKPIQD